MDNEPALEPGTHINVVNGPFAGCDGVVLDKYESDSSGLFQWSYHVMVEVEGTPKNAYLNRNEIQVISN